MRQGLTFPLKRRNQLSHRDSKETTKVIVTVSIREENSESVSSVSASMPVPGAGVYMDFVLAIANAGDIAIAEAQGKGWLL